MSISMNINGDHLTISRCQNGTYVHVTVSHRPDFPNGWARVDVLRNADTVAMLPNTPAGASMLADVAIAALDLDRFHPERSAIKYAVERHVLGC